MCCCRNLLSLYNCCCNTSFIIFFCINDSINDIELIFLYTCHEYKISLYNKVSTCLYIILLADQPLNRTLKNHITFYQCSFIGAFEGQKISLLRLFVWVWKKVCPCVYQDTLALKTPTIMKIGMYINIIYVNNSLEKPVFIKFLSNWHGRDRLFEL